MSAIKLVYTGSKSFNRMLNALGSEHARKINQQAMREAMRLVLDEARKTSPVSTGALRSSLAIRAMKRSAKSIGIVVQQRAGAFKGETYYGSFIEFGYQTGRRRAIIEWKVSAKRAAEMKTTGVRVKDLDESGGWVRKWRKSKPADNSVLDSRKKASNPRRKIEGRWFMRNAAVTKEQDAVAVYYDGLERMIKAEAKTSGND